HLHAVIELPEALIYGTGIPGSILVFKKHRSEKNVLFIVASDEGNIEKVSDGNLLRTEDVERIYEMYKNYETVDKFSYVASLEEIEENDYNLNIPRYVDTFEEEEPVDMEQVAKNIEDIQSELKEVEG